MSSENYRVEKQDAVYFLTFTVTDWVDVFTLAPARLYRVGNGNCNLVMPHDAIVRQRGGERI